MYKISCLPPEEKSRIRQTILKTFEEENNAVIIYYV